MQRLQSLGKYHIPMKLMAKTFYNFMVGIINCPGSSVMLSPRKVNVHIVQNRRLRLLVEECHGSRNESRICERGAPT